MSILLAIISIMEIVAKVLTSAISIIQKLDEDTTQSLKRLREKHSLLMVRKRINKRTSRTIARYNHCSVCQYRLQQSDGSRITYREFLDDVMS